MPPLEILPFLALLAVAGLWVTAPLRRGRRGAAGAADVTALEAERDARLAAVRDAELDLQTGKLSADDHRELDARLRAEAMEALAEADAARARQEPRK